LLTGHRDRTTTAILNVDGHVHLFDFTGGQIRGASAFFDAHACIPFHRSLDRANFKDLLVVELKGHEVRQLGYLIRWEIAAVDGTGLQDWIPPAGRRAVPPGTILQCADRASFDNVSRNPVKKCRDLITLRDLGRWQFLSN
jgi:hypothetical protein